MNDSPSLAPPLPVEAPTLRTYLGISLFWFALSFFWGAMLSLVLPDRVEQIVGPAHKDHVLMLIASSGAFVSGVTQIVFGALSDNCTHRLGRRRPYLIVGVLATTVVLLFFPGARTVGALLGVYLGIQLFLNIGHGPYQALMPDLIPLDHHGRASSFMGVSLLLGRIGGPVIAAILLKQGEQGVWLLTLTFIFRSQRAVRCESVSSERETARAWRRRRADFEGSFARAFATLSEFHLANCQSFWHYDGRLYGAILPVLLH